jgi:hypothetical protein
MVYLSKRYDIFMDERRMENEKKSVGPEYASYDKHSTNHMRRIRRDRGGGG